MNRELYRLLRETKEKCTKAMNELKMFCEFTKVELPHKYFEYKALTEFCDFLLNNENKKSLMQEVKDEDTK